jgi:hypothetical protein
LKFDRSIPDGTPRKTLDNSLLKTLELDWPVVDLLAGLKLTYKDFLRTPYAQPEKN